MFEKEAEEYAKQNNPAEYGVRATHFTVLNSFKDGAEFGYNKANEWHKPSEKLPEECSLVLAYGFDDTEPSLYYFVASDFWEWMPRRIASLSNDQIRLWKEIVLPELPKESE